MLAYLNSVWNYRYFWMSLVRIDLRTRYRRSLLGMGWSLLNPILMTAIICTVFHQVFKVEVRSFAPFLLAGLATWTYIVSSTLSGCQCFFQSESYIRQQAAPLAIYSLRTTLGTTLHFLIALSVLLVSTWLFKGLGNLPALIWLVPAVLLLFVFLWGLATVAGVVNVLFPDVHNLTEVGFQLFFYATPIIYPPRFLQGSVLGRLLALNPFGHFVTLIRGPIVDGTAPPLASLGMAALSATLAALLASLVLARYQKKLIFYM